jgi:hypothetical protein
MKQQYKSTKHQAIFPSDVIDIQVYVESKQFRLVELCFFIMLLNSLLVGAIRD